MNKIMCIVHAFDEFPNVVKTVMMMTKLFAIILLIRCSLVQGEMFTCSCTRVGEIRVFLRMYVDIFLHMMLTSLTLDIFNLIT